MGTQKTRWVCPGQVKDEVRLRECFLKLIQPKTGFPKHPWELGRKSRSLSSEECLSEPQVSSVRWDVGSTSLHYLLSGFPWLPFNFSSSVIQGCSAYTDFSLHSFRPNSQERSERRLYRPGPRPPRGPAELRVPLCKEGLPPPSSAELSGPEEVARAFTLIALCCCKPALMPWE